MKPVFYIGKEQAKLGEQLEEKELEIKDNESKMEKPRKRREDLERNFVRWKCGRAREIEMAKPD